MLGHCLRHWRNFENVLAKNKEIVILGDLNINYILDEHLCENQAHFIETLLCCKQLIFEPTRVTQSSQSVIDHIYTTMPHNHLDHGILKYSLSDHYLIFTTLKFRRQASSPKIIHKKEYNRININDFNRDLVDIGLYSAVIDAKSTSDAWRDSSNAFNTEVNKHVKIKEIRVKDRSNPWMTNEILALIYKRDYTHRMAVRLTLLTKWMNLKNWEIWSSQQFETRNDPIIRKQSQPINPVTFGKQ